MSQLIWVKYETEHHVQKTMLLFELGMLNGLMHCIVTDLLMTSETAAIRNNIDELDKLDIIEKAELLKKICPGCLKAYRTRRLDRMQIINTYPIESPKDPKDPMQQLT